MKQLDLFSFEVSVCKECDLFQSTNGNYGWCMKPKIGSLDRSVYENSTYCEMERRLYNNDILTRRLKGIIPHEKMHELWKR